MSKILYIEDQLVRNITSIRKIFNPIFKDNRTLKLLDDIDNSTYKKAEMIIEACSYTSCLDICHTYVNALAKIINNYKDYDLVIIDRNLSENSYHEDIDDIKLYLRQCGFDDPEEKITSYKTREGDLLLLILLKLDKRFKDKIYYLTANLDEIRGSQMLKTLIDVDDFHENHIIEKNPEKEVFLSNLISDLPSFTIQNDFKTQCDIIRKKLGEDWVKKFIRMIRHYREDNKEECILFLRMLLANKLLTSIAKKMNEPEAPYWKRENLNQLVTKGFIKNCFSIDKATGQKTYWGLPKFNELYNIGYTSVIRNACLSIAEICSDCIHGDFDNFERDVTIRQEEVDALTQYTMRSLLNQICDVILWYNEAIDLIGDIKS